MAQAVSIPNERLIFTGITIPDDCAEALWRREHEIWERSCERCTANGDGTGASELHGFNEALTMLGLMPAVREAGNRLRREAARKE